MYFKTPCSIVAYSPSNCGKTTLILEIIKNRKFYFSEEIFEIIYHYNAWCDKFSDQKDIRFIQGDQIDIPTDSKPRILVIDDLMSSKSAQKTLTQIFTVDGHHYNITCIFATQALFAPELRVVSANAKVFFINGAMRNTKSVNIFLSQLDFDFAFLKSAYQEACGDGNDYNFLLIDLQQKISSELRVGSKVLDQFPVFYVPRDNIKRLPLAVTYNG